MATYSSPDVAYVFVGDDTWQAYLNSVTMKISANVVDTTPLGTAWQVMSDTGLRSGEFTCAGFYDGTKTVMNTVSATDKAVSVLLEGNVASDRFYGFRAATVSAAEIGISSDNVHTSTPELNVRGAVDYGYVVAPLAARTTAGNTQLAYADLGAAATAPRAYLHVTSLTLGGYDNLVVTLQSCATSGGSYDDETAFTAVTAVGSETIAISGAVNRYLAIKWAWTGAGTGNTFTAFVGCAPV
jgi:hypothetical protein